MVRISFSIGDRKFDFDINVSLQSADEISALIEKVGENVLGKSKKHPSTEDYGKIMLVLARELVKQEQGQDDPEISEMIQNYIKKLSGLH